MKDETTTKRGGLLLGPHEECERWKGWFRNNVLSAIQTKLGVRVNEAQKLIWNVKWCTANIEWLGTLGIFQPLSEENMEVGVAKGESDVVAQEMNGAGTSDVRADVDTTKSFEDLAVVGFTATEWQSVGDRARAILKVDHILEGGSGIVIGCRKAHRCFTRVEHAFQIEGHKRYFVHEFKQVVRLIRLMRALDMLEWMSDEEIWAQLQEADGVVPLEKYRIYSSKCKGEQRYKKILQEIDRSFFRFMEGSAEYPDVTVEIEKMGRSYHVSERYHGASANRVCGLSVDAGRDHGAAVF